MSSKGLEKKWASLILMIIKVIIQMMITLLVGEAKVLCRRKLLSLMVQWLRLLNRATERSHRCQLSSQKKRKRKILLSRKTKSRLKMTNQKIRM